MVCCAVVLITRSLVLFEVGGDAVVYIELDVASIVMALGDLLDDFEWWKVLAAVGFRRVAGFMWDDCVVAHIMVYKRAIAR